MKTVLTKFLAVSSIGLLMLASCKKQGVEVKSNGGKPGDLTANTTSLPLDKAMVNDTTKVITFNFTKASYGFSAAVSNVLQIDAQGDNWANPTTFTMANGKYSQGFSTFDFNNLVLKLNLAAGVASPVNVRVAHVLASNVPPVYSNTLSVTVTPFNLTSWVYVPGAYEGWSFPGKNADSLISVTGNGVYTGIINFTAGNNQFLIVPAQSWTNKWATGQGALTGTPVTYTTTYNGANNFYAPTAAGNYLLTFDSNAGTLKIEPADFYSVIGNDFTGQNWDADNAMKYVNDGNGNWTATLAMIAPSGGGFKIRQDAAWSNSWGLSASNGMLTNNSGGNMTIPSAGTYTITFTMPATALGTNIANPLLAGYSITQ